MARIGDAEFAQKGALCPFCSAKKGKWAVFQKAGRYFFKCHKPECPANEPEGGSSEIGYLMLRKGYSMKEASTEYLKLAVPDKVPHLFTKPTDKVPKGQPILSDTAFDDEPPLPSPANPWEALHRKLPLNTADTQKLIAKRGFSEETIQRHGIRSNNQACRPLVESLTETYSVTQLIAEGIYKEEGRQRPGPSGQFCGYGITGEKDSNGDAIWEITEPPIIPYYDERGTVFYLRPHKGGVRKPKDELEEMELCEDEEEERHCASFVFVPRGFEELVTMHDGLAILTEGEFKAIAGVQCEMPVFSCPGISFIRNPDFRRKLEQVIERAGITHLVIIFDNEVKNDPAFPKRYKPDPNDQWDTQAYAEYTMRSLKSFMGRRGGTVLVGNLPDEQRIDGKADFDGILAKCVAEHGLDKGTKEARKIFRKAVREASETPAADLFATEGRRIIEWKVEQFVYVPSIPIGGKRELKLSQRFGEYDANPWQANVDDENAQDEEAKLKPGVVDRELADAFESVLGCYYLRKAPDKDERKELRSLANHFSGAIATLKERLKEQRPADTSGKVIHTQHGSWDAELRGKLKILYSRQAAAWERIKGIPRPISTYTVKCEYNLRTPDGNVRLVRIRRRRQGKTLVSKHLERLTAADTRSCQHFREWGNKIGDCNFGGEHGGGEKDLQELTKDMDHQSYQRDIHEINTFGYHADSKLWLFGDCAFPPTGPIIHADQSGIFWYHGQGYQVTGDEGAGEAFCQGLPLLLSAQDRAARADNAEWLKAMRTFLAGHASKEARDLAGLADKMLNSTEHADCELLIKNAPAALQSEIRTVLTQAVFTSATEDMYNTIGDYDGWTAIGLMLAYAIGPDLCRVGGHPGVWLTGKMSSGKTTIGRWMMRMWGYKELGGIKLGQKSSTAVGLNRGLTQYSSQPVLLDEYRRDNIDAEKEEVLRGAFDRSGGLKGIADHSNKTRNPISKTTPIVMGESSSGDAATRSRYAQIHVSERKRIGDGTARYTRLQQDTKHWYLIGRWLMENREEFATDALKSLAMWMKDDSVRAAIQNERVRLVYGVAFATMLTAGAMLGTITVQQKNEYQTFLLKHGAQGLQDVIEETFLARFLTDIITYVQRGKIERKYFAERYVTIDENGHAKEVNANTTPSAQHVCFIGLKNVFDAYLAHKRTIGESASLGYGDVRRELERESYWIKNPKTGDKVHRIRMGGVRTTCAVISLEREPGDAPEEMRPYLFPFSEDLVNVLNPEKSTEE